MALLEFRVLLVDHKQPSLSTDEFAVRRTDFDGSSGLHDTCLFLVTERDATFGQIVGRHVDANAITWQNLDVEFPHFPRDVGGDDVTILQLDPEHCVSEGFVDGSILCYRRLLRHRCCFVFFSVNLSPLISSLSLPILPRCTQMLKGLQRHFLQPRRRAQNVHLANHPLLRWSNRHLREESFSSPG